MAFTGNNTFEHATDFPLILHRHCSLSENRQAQNCPLLAKSLNVYYEIWFSRTTKKEKSSNVNEMDHPSSKIDLIQLNNICGLFSILTPAAQLRAGNFADSDEMSPSDSRALSDYACGIALTHHIAFSTTTASEKYLKFWCGFGVNLCNHQRLADCH